MISATMYEYRKPLKIQDATKKPTITNGQQVLVKVGATGLCHSDLHLINGDWKNSIPLQLPIVLGHEIAGYIEEVGDMVPSALFAQGDMVVVFGGWGCGVCIHCKSGNEQMCNFAKWPGIMTDGGFAEYVLVDSYRFLVKVQGKDNIRNSQSSETKLTIEEVAPLTDAGLTPYRAVKKLILFFFNWLYSFISKGKVCTVPFPHSNSGSCWRDFHLIYCYHFIKEC